MMESGVEWCGMVWSGVEWCGVETGEWVGLHDMEDNRLKSEQVRVKCGVVVAERGSRERGRGKRSLFLTFTPTVRVVLQIQQPSWGGRLVGRLDGATQRTVDRTHSAAIQPAPTATPATPTATPTTRHTAGDP